MATTLDTDKAVPVAEGFPVHAAMFDGRLTLTLQDMDGIKRAVVVEQNGPLLYLYVHQVKPEYIKGGK